jgi:hypothetical protein
MSLPMLTARLASILCWLSGIGFGLFCLPAITNVLSGKAVPVVMGFQAYGGGPFERFGLHTTAPLLAGFLLVCACECVAGWLLWGGHRSGAVMVLALLPFEVVYWWGFSLPYGPVLAVVRTVLILVSWRSFV